MDEKTPNSDVEEKKIYVTNTQQIRNKLEFIGKHGLGRSEPEITYVELKDFISLRFGTLSGFARALGLSRSHACRLLTGERVPKKLISIERIANVIGIDRARLTKLFQTQEEKNKLFPFKKSKKSTIDDKKRDIT